MPTAQTASEHLRMERLHGGGRKGAFGHVGLGDEQRAPGTQTLRLQQRAGEQEVLARVCGARLPAQPFGRHAELLAAPREDHRLRLGPARGGELPEAAAAHDERRRAAAIESRRVFRDAQLVVAEDQDHVRPLRRGGRRGQKIEQRSGVVHPGRSFTHEAFPLFSFSP